VCNLCNNGNRAGTPSPSSDETTRQGALARAEVDKPMETANDGKADAAEPPPDHDDPDFAAEVRAEQRRGWLSGPARETRRRAERAYQTRNDPFRAVHRPPADRCSVCGAPFPPGRRRWASVDRLVDTGMGATVGTGNLEIQVRYWICPDCWNAGNLPFSILPAEDRYAPDQIPSLERVAKDLLYVAERYALPVTREIVLHIVNALMALGRRTRARNRRPRAGGKRRGQIRSLEPLRPRPRPFTRRSAEDGPRRRSGPPPVRSAPLPGGSTGCAGKKAWA
jgi:hypothetical protein